MGVPPGRESRVYYWVRTSADARERRGVCRRWLGNHCDLYFLGNRDLSGNLDLSGDRDLLGYRNLSGDRDLLGYRDLLGDRDFDRFSDDLGRRGIAVSTRNCRYQRYCDGDED